MKKFIFAAALIAASVSMNAQDYNRVALSYDYTGLNFNKEMDMFGTDKAETLGTNGFGLNYIHGFGVANNMFVEAGANVDFLFGSRTEKYVGGEYTFKTQNINLQVPVNFVYRFNITEGVSIDPYVGLNFKLHFSERFKDGDGEDDKWMSVFDDGEDAMDGKDYTWNRFQMGWHVGVGVNYERYYLGVQVGTDFIPAYSHDFKYGGESYKCKVNTTNVKVSLGYTF
ncbi:MAG: PorT family protein [Muribaculum sp.]|nr:PorT family protein [Muribaculum sp.]MDE6458972.1 PorT family protein [Muribaculum sp.]